MVHTWVLAGAIVAAGWVEQSAAPAPVYDATFSVTTENGVQAYTGTTTFVVDAKGGVTGKMNLAQPTAVEGTLSGTIKARDVDVRVTVLDRRAELQRDGERDRHRAGRSQGDLRHGDHPRRVRAAAAVSDVHVQAAGKEGRVGRRPTCLCSRSPS